MANQPDKTASWNPMHLRNFLIAVRDMERAGRPMSRADAPICLLAVQLLDRGEGDEAITNARKEAVEKWPDLMDHERAGLTSQIDEPIADGYITTDGESLRPTPVGIVVIESLAKAGEDPTAGHGSAS